jgi:hypothetical protein
MALIPKLIVRVSIPVTRSDEKPHVKAVITVGVLMIRMHRGVRVPAACPMGSQNRLALPR